MAVGWIGIAVLCGEKLAVWGKSKVERAKERGFGSLSVGCADVDASCEEAGGCFGSELADAMVVIFCDVKVFLCVKRQSSRAAESRSRSCGVGFSCDAACKKVELSVWIEFVDAVCACAGDVQDAFAIVVGNPRRGGEYASGTDPRFDHPRRGFVDLSIAIIVDLIALNFEGGEDLIDAIGPVSCAARSITLFARADAFGGDGAVIASAACVLLAGAASAHAGFLIKACAVAGSAVGLVCVEIDAGFSTQGAARSASIGTNTCFAEFCTHAFFRAFTAVVAIGFERNTLSVAHTAVSAVKDALAVFAKVTNGTGEPALPAIFGIFVKLCAGVVAKSGFSGATDAATTSPADTDLAKFTGFSALAAMIGIFLHIGATQSA